MADSAHKETDKQLAELEKKLEAIYAQANSELEDKATKFFEKFAEKDEKKKQEYADGKITKQEYESWKVGQIMTGKHWEEMKAQTAEEMLKANQTAAAYINNQLPETYAKNYNAVGSGVAGQLKGYSFELVDASTVKNLATSDETLLPYKYVDGKKDVRWNTQKVNSEVMQGILQGDSMQGLAKRLGNVTEMNKASAIRNARTSVTSAENKGRMDSLAEAKAKGVVMKKIWLAAHDERVREAHLLLDGQEKDFDEPFDSILGDIMYPGDPDADPANVYNCRCTLTYSVVDESEADIDDSISSEEDEAEQEPEFDKAQYEDMSMTAMFYSVKDENKELGKEFWNTLQENGKPSVVWKQYLNGELPADVSSQIDGILSQYNGTGSPKKPVSEKKLAAEKALNDAKDAQEKAQDAFDAYDNLTFSGIWKDDVTLDDYEYKKDSIQAKMDYFLQKQADEPGNPKWDQMIASLNEFQTKGEEYSELKAELKDAKKKVWELSGQSQDAGLQAAYSQERKDAALWAKSPREADGYLRDRTGEVWRQSTSTERSAIYEYTRSFHKFNEPLRGIEYGTERKLGVGNTDLNAAGNGRNLNAMTNIIDKCSYDVDIWMQRGAGYKGMDSFFGVSESLLRSGTQEQLENALLDKAVTDFGFFSCGDAKGSGFSSNPIIMNVFAPNGTKMMYAEPFSAFGNGSGKNWDGKSTQGSFGSEAEVILQQGTTFRITKVDRASSRDTIYLDLEVVSQGETQKWHK